MAVTAEVLSATTVSFVEPADWVPMLTSPEEVETLFIRRQPCDNVQAEYGVSEIDSAGPSYFTLAVNTSSIR